MKYYVYTEEDKRSLIENIGNYRLPLKTFIRSNMHEWFEQAIDYNDESILMKHRILQITDKNIQKVLLMVLDKPADNREDITDLLLTLNSIVSWDSRECELSISDIEFILFEILLYKVRACDLANKIQNKNNNNSFWNFKSNSEFLEMIHRCYLSKINTDNGQLENYCILLSLFYNAFKLTLSDAKPFFYLIYRNNPFSKKIFDKYISMTKDPSVDLMDFINNLHEIENLDIPDMHWNQDNYSKKIISTNCRNNISVFGSNIFNGEQQFKNFLSEIKRLTPEYISYYMNGMKESDISFSINENNLCFIRYEYQLEPVVINDKNIERKFVRMPNNDTILLLFKNIKEPNKIYGISINQIEKPKTRMIVTFVNNPKITYKLESGDVLL